jgi:hypothetical protein
MQERVGKPPKHHTESLKKPLKADYHRLVQACVEAIIAGENDVLIAFSYTLKFPKGFPKGILMEETRYSDIRRVKAKRLLHWLHDNGHTNITPLIIRKQAMAMGRLSSFLNACDDLDVDIDQELGDNVVSLEDDDE